MVRVVARASRAACGRAGNDYRVGMMVILVVCVLHTLLGGPRAVIGMDFIHGCC